MTSKAQPFISDDESLSLSFSLDLLDDMEDPLRALQFRVLLEGRESSRQIGKGLAYFLDTVGTNIWVRLDDESQDLSDIASEIVDGRTGALVGPLEDCLGLLILDTLVIDPEFRGRSLGHLIVERLIRDLGRGCEYAIGRPYPIFEDRDSGPKPGSPEHEAARRALVRHWEKLGMEQISDQIYGINLELRAPIDKMRAAARAAIDVLWAN